MVNISHLKTETQNPRTLTLDRLPVNELLKIMNEEDRKCSEAVEEALPAIEEAVAHCVKSLRQDGRIIYVGAGTSGRMGVMDAVECLPTFSSENVVACIAGGNGAFVKAVEGAEDSKEGGRNDLINLELSSKDTVIGIAASGRTPYVIGALDYARQTGAKTVSVSCNKDAEISKHADTAIEVDAGPEILTGSTRLKSGTCQKMILNMISTTSMVQIGKVYGNLMVDLKATNEKLVERSIRIVVKATGADRETAVKALKETGGAVKSAVVMLKLNINKDEAEKRLKKADGFVYKAVGE